MTNMQSVFMKISVADKKHLIGKKQKPGETKYFHREENFFLRMRRDETTATLGMLAVTCKNNDHNVQESTLVEESEFQIFNPCC